MSNIFTGAGERARDAFAAREPIDVCISEKERKTSTSPEVNVNVVATVKVEGKDDEVISMDANLVNIMAIAPSADGKKDKKSIAVCTVGGASPKDMCELLNHMVDLMHRILSTFDAKEQHGMVMGAALRFAILMECIDREAMESYSDRVNKGLDDLAQELVQHILETISNTKN